MKNISVYLIIIVFISFTCFTGCDANPAPPDSADLISLDISDIELIPAFSSDITSYSASVYNLIDEVAVSITPENLDALVSGAGTHSLDVGDNTIIISVTSEDESTSREYVIVIERRPAVLGHYYTDVTFSIDDSPYYVTGDIVIESGVTCTIDEGVEFVMAIDDAMVSGENTSKVEFVIQGTLDVNGSEAAPVIFRSVSADEQPAGWYGILADESGAIVDIVYADIRNPYVACNIKNSAEANISNTLIAFGYYGIFTDQGSIFISNCEIRNCIQNGMQILDPVAAEVSGCVLSGNKNGINFYGNAAASGVLQISNCTIDANNKGIYTYHDTEILYVYNSIITNNLEEGLQSFNSAGLEIDYSDVWGNGTDYSSVPPGPECFSSNPRYVGYPDDMSLSENSPCRNKGNDGNDIGALPYSGL